MKTVYVFATKAAEPIRSTDPFTPRYAVVGDADTLALVQDPADAILIGERLAQHHGALLMTMPEVEAARAGRLASVVAFKAGVDRARREGDSQR